MNNTSNGNKASTSGKPFKIPTRAELEERRKQIDANKPTILFKPKGIITDSDLTSASNKDSLDTNATNSTQPSNSNTSKTILDNSSQALASSNASTIARPVIVSSRQHYQQQQQQQQQKQAQAIDDDDFGFGGDLNDIDFNDDIFDEVDRPTSKTISKQPELSSSTTVKYDTSTTTPTQASTQNSSASNRTTETAGNTAVATPSFQPKSRSTVIVRTSQRGNPLLQFIRNVPYEYGEVIPDFVVGMTSCVLFLSIRYHRLHPEYIFSRIASLGNSFVLRVLLLLVDVDTHQQAIREMTRVAMVNDLTLICAWSNEEAARYIETFKAYENKPPDAIKERTENDYLSKLTDGLTQIPSINKTDVVTLATTFGSFKNIMDASADELGLLPGFGERKVKRLLEAFDQPFTIDPKKRRHRRP
ncbi:ssDNA endonuclease and repair protein rad10 [Linnemannia zychae]|nr:ssDNA endonuclease and repair protein rad10 [Linnemannia zychae]